MITPADGEDECRPEDVCRTPEAPDVHLVFRGVDADAEITSHCSFLSRRYYHIAQRLVKQFLRKTERKKDRERKKVT